MTKKKKPDIDYPGPWIYTLIGLDREALENMVARVMGERQHTVSLSRTSSGGKYVSLEIEATVQSEQDRLALFDALRFNPEVKIIL